jgi:hypothetical protein
VLRHNSFVSNTLLGVLKTDGPSLDARYNWWGHPSGPYHATRNPDGLGNGVGQYDNVLFDPWLTSPPTQTAMLDQVIVDVAGAAGAVPGQTVAQAIQVLNDTDGTIEDAVLVLKLAPSVEYLRSTHGGQFWPGRNEVYWLLGNLAPSESRLVAATLGVQWGLPNGSEHPSLARLAAANLDNPDLNPELYRNHEPTEIATERALSEAEIAAEQAAHPKLDDLCDDLTARDYARVGGRVLTTTEGAVQTEISFMHDLKGTTAIARRDGDAVWISEFDPTAVSIQAPNGGITVDLTTYASEAWGLPPGLSEASALSLTARSDIGALSGLGASSPRLDQRIQCWRNCVIEQIPGWSLGAASNLYNALSNAATCKRCLLGGTGADCRACAATVSKASGADKGLAIAECAVECAQDPSSHVCTEDKYTCSGAASVFYQYIGSDAAGRIQCNETLGIYAPGPDNWVKCYSDQVCIEGQGCVDCEELPGGGAASGLDLLVTGSGESVGCGASGGDDPCDRFRFSINLPKDPNAKYGPEGDLLPGERVTYTVTYENVGQGQAYGVYVTDRLDDVYDTDTLSVYGDGVYLDNSRTILWTIGELAPAGEVGSTGAVSFTVRLRDDLVSGDVVRNQATVFFPTVPEETPTNAVVNLIAPIVAEPLTATTNYGRPVTLTLTARAVGTAPLTYRIVDAPLGTLTGTLPVVTYTPPDGYTGGDRFSFAVSNGVDESPATAVRIEVLPSGDDVTPPTVRWTSPELGKVVPFVESPWLTNTTGDPVYEPHIALFFSERLEAGTVSSQTLTLSSPSGTLPRYTVAYDDGLRQATVTLHDRLSPGVTYTVTAGTGVEDLSGNALTAPYAWSFSVAEGPKVYLPVVLRRSGDD